MGWGMEQFRELDGFISGRGGCESVGARQTTDRVTQFLAVVATQFPDVTTFLYLSKSIKAINDTAVSAVERRPHIATLRSNRECLVDRRSRKPISTLAASPLL